MRQTKWLVLIVSILTACSPAADQAPEATRDSPGALTSTPAGPLVLTGPTNHLDDVAARETMVVELGDALFVSGYGSQVSGVDPNAVPFLWTSGDRGGSWARVDVGTAADGARGNSDIDLAACSDGTLYLLSMGFDRSVGEGVHIAVGVSRDLGGSWTWHQLSEDRFDDRPWIDCAPDGTVHVIWNDGSGVSYVTSTDQGQTWTEHERIHPQGGSSHLDVGPDGQIAVRITPLSASGKQFDEGVELIAVSVDGGSTWAKHQVPGERTWDPTFSNPELNSRWVEPVAWDDEGALFLLWAEGATMLLARSLDDGASWSTWTLSNESAMAYFPYLIARGDGELAATWFTGLDNELEAHVAAIQIAAEDGDPEMRRTRSFQPETWREVDEPMRETGGEYLPVIFLANGDLGVTSTIQNRAEDRWGFSWWTVSGL